MHTCDIKYMTHFRFVCACTSDEVYSYVYSYEYTSSYVTRLAHLLCARLEICAIKYSHVHIFIRIHMYTYMYMNVPRSFVVCSLLCEHIPNEHVTFIYMYVYIYIHMDMYMSI